MFAATILTPTEVVLDEKVPQLSVPGWSGDLALGAGHADLVTPLRPGAVVAGGVAAGRFFVSGGLLEVSGGAARIYADALERPEEIDVARAEGSAQRAAERLSSRPEGDAVDVARALASLARARARLALSRMK